MLFLELLSTVFGLIALVLALFVPGHFLCLGFFPAKKDLGKMERLVFAFVFSIAFLPLLVLFENLLLKLPINFFTVLGSLLFLVLLGLVLYFARTGSLPLPKKVSAFLKPVEKSEAVSLLPFQ